MDVVCHSDPAKLPKAKKGVIPVQLYGSSPQLPGATCVGGPVLDEVRHLGIRVPQNAFDFLTVAMAVTAADTFVLRSDADDGWCRDIHLVVTVGNAAPWKKVAPILENALFFLSGDVWRLEIVDGGRAVPPPQSRGNLIRVHGHEVVCLFSGGLDSTIGALNLIADGVKPLLVSHAYRGDQKRQIEVCGKLPKGMSHFAPNANPTGAAVTDVSMRTRSINFIAFGAVAASVLALWTKNSVPLFVPENGVISLNPPLTHRRLGALSTRTTHPHFMSLVQDVLDGLGIPARLDNPYRFKTKGEMMRECRDQATLAKVAVRTVSCGKWKRKNKQCGRCVPCLIRRAAFHAAGIADTTPYRFTKLSRAMADEQQRDDILAMELAVRKAKSEPLGPWVALSGPLSTDRATRDQYVDVFGRGMAEMENYLYGQGLV